MAKIIILIFFLMGHRQFLRETLHVRKTELKETTGCGMRWSAKDVVPSKRLSESF